MGGRGYVGGKRGTPGSVSLETAALATHKFQKNENNSECFALVWNKQKVNNCAKNGQKSVARSSGDHVKAGSPHLRTAPRN